MSLINRGTSLYFKSLEIRVQKIIYTNIKIIYQYFVIIPFLYLIRTKEKMYMTFKIPCLLTRSDEVNIPLLVLLLES